jgi:hypothetical protein
MLGFITVNARFVDEQNREFARDEKAEFQLGEQPPFEKKISPVESFDKEIVFDLPADLNLYLKNSMMNLGLIALIYILLSTITLYLFLENFQPH